MATPPLLSVLLVNYNTAALTRSCVASLRAQRVSRPDGSAGEIEILVVDNASRLAERQALAGLDAGVLYNDTNPGYGAALNQAAARAGGEFLLFSNPDTWYFPGALQTLLEGFHTLPRCGAVGPRRWWDLDREFLLPPSDPVTLLGYLQEAAAQVWPRWRRHWERRWLRRALRYWRVRQPLAQSMLSGACILTRREVLAVCGGFDERFHLYYEDADWCRRLRHGGYRLYYVPEAEVAHLYNQSARQQAEEAQRTFAASAARYFCKHYGKRLWRITSTVMNNLRTRVRSQDGTRDYVALGTLADPPRLSLPDAAQGACLLRLSPLPSCTPAIARFLPAPLVSLPAPVWAQLGEGDFYAQLLSLPDLQLLGQWCWRKQNRTEQ